jgi:hypothetical protein
MVLGSHMMERGFEQYGFANNSRERNNVKQARSRGREQ